MQFSRSFAISLVAAGVLVIGVGGYFGYRMLSDERLSADADDPELVALGRAVYADQCAACHGARLEGQPNWRTRNPDGSFPAPPHDASGHTWHHSDQLLIDVTRHGGAKNAPPGFRSTMPAFADKLSDRQIHAVLAFIKSRWPQTIRDRQERITAQSK